MNELTNLMQQSFSFASDYLFFLLLLSFFFLGLRFFVIFALDKSSCSFHFFDFFGDLIVDIFDYIVDLFEKIYLKIKNKKINKYDFKLSHLDELEPVRFRSGNYYETGYKKYSRSYNDNLHNFRG